MIIVRDVFQLKFGKAKDALSLMKPLIKKMNDNGTGKFRLLTDLVGNYYTLVIEGSYGSMEEYLKVHEQSNDVGWDEVYPKFVELVMNGYRDIWTVEE